MRVLSSEAVGPMLYASRVASISPTHWMAHKLACRLDAVPDNQWQWVINRSPDPRRIHFYNLVMGRGVFVYDDGRVEASGL